MGSVNYNISIINIMGRETKEVWLSSPCQTTPHLGVPEDAGLQEGARAQLSPHSRSVSLPGLQENEAAPEPPPQLPKHACLHV